MEKIKYCAVVKIVEFLFLKGANTKTKTIIRNVFYTLSLQLQQYTTGFSEFKRGCTNLEIDPHTGRPQH